MAYNIYFRAISVSRLLRALCLVSHCLATSGKHLARTHFNFFTPQLQTLTTPKPLNETPPFQSDDLPTVYNYI